MKIWACAKKNGQFLNHDDGRFKLFFIWQVLKIKREDPDLYDSLVFFSTHSKALKRRQLIPVKGGWFRYKEIGPRGECANSQDGQSLSHAFVIAALSQLKTINFIIGDQKISFTFTRLEAEEVELRFGNGRYYIPDLYGEFTDDNLYFKKWGGKVVIEVWVTHQCEPRKIKDFENHGVPIIEVRVTSGLQVEKYIKPDDLEASLECSFARVKEIVSEKVYAKIISDPVSLAYHHDAMVAEKFRLHEMQRAKDAEMANLKMSMSATVASLRDEVTNKQLALNSKISECQGVVRKLENAEKTIQEKINEARVLREELNVEKSKGVWERLCLSLRKR
ncbi:hypothetical protein V6W80_19405 [Pseudomonas benzopyrenica]|uniref:Uncharacterized protein n=1 Tax=Pseudomonas benzopyrenica TaxID=2993566 RepID=A0ABZ2FNT6_9PSED